MTETGGFEMISRGRKFSVGVDFDGVIHSYKSPWTKAHEIPDPPVPGAIEFLSAMLQKFNVYIFSTRCKTWRGRRAVRQYIHRHAGDGLWYPVPAEIVPMEELRFTYKKLPCLVYIDDRGYRFDGANWPTVDEIHRMKPWNK